MPLRPHELQQLRKLPLFAEMSLENLERLLDAALLQQFPAGVVLIHEGDQADFLHVLIDGLAEALVQVWEQLGLPLHAKSMAAE